MDASNAPRIAPLEPPFAPEVEAELRKWMPPGAPVPPLALFRTLARNHPLAQAMRGLGSYFLGRRFSLGLRAREVVIDRVCARLGCAYEWGVHAAAFGAAAGLDDAAIRATAAGTADDPAFTEEDRLLVEMVDALCDRATVPDELWSRLAARYADAEILELLALAGWYHAIAFVANAARVAPEAWAAAFPEGVSPAT